MDLSKLADNLIVQDNFHIHIILHIKQQLQHMVGGGASDHMISGNIVGCQYTLQIESCHGAKFVITGNTTDCNND